MGSLDKPSKSTLRKTPRLEGAMVKGMRPLYKAIRSQELVLVRPFRNKEAALRPYLRYFQWSQIWGSQEAPTEAILPDLQQRAIEEAKGLEPISPEMLRAKFQCLPEKAPGASGWSNRMLKQLPRGLATADAALDRNGAHWSVAWPVARGQVCHAGQKSGY